ncbi:stromal cell-derived factor 2-like protein isoform X2 [Elaeis guineensis]|uniref:Stromal cell-derived factor 2-like protein isoform X2 n=1 Tax=Elaeis guineensis var. tenera TaxID=51953 RepID=A0A6J0PLJ8_ELAGV|nr:stromal cell-derived factor 2-like protein isoform X2 [Elaeis guineensis]
MYQCELGDRLFLVLIVSCFGGDRESDTGDYRRLEIEGNGKTWRQDQKIRLQHVDTGGYLHSHNKKYSRIAGGQQEDAGISDSYPLTADDVQEEEENLC